ncbi:MFS transporter [Pseudonocardia acaciae]|uniref:MFS transporter n=1 Tax=Pseudonocardia acaciae TaxID=551276 RepID=UPI0004910C40|nr:MFS transporter [Pseudonocardia acaciae]
MRVANTAPPAGRTVNRVTLAGTLGMYLEFYDYAIYGFLAGNIATVFFPGHDATAALLATYSVFALTFIFRPLGGLVLGSLADRIGRRTVLVLSLTLMTVSVAVIGVLPGYASIGVTATVLLIAMRLLQGFSAGGEVGAAITFVAEYSPSGQRALRIAWVQMGSFSALLTGTLLAWGLSGALGEPAMDSWGWRIPFLVAVPLGVIGYLIRARLDETPVYRELKQTERVASSPVKETLLSGPGLKNLSRALLIPLLNSSGYYVLFVYMPTYLKTSLHFSTGKALALTAAGLIVLIACMPFAAALSDRIGRRPVLLSSAVAMAVLAWPAYRLISLGNLAAALAGVVLLAVAFSGHTGVVHAALIELFPTRVRNTGYSMGYNINTAVFGGGGPLLMTYLIAHTGDTGFPAYYAIITAVGTGIAVLLTHETGRKELVA